MTKNPSLKMYQTMSTRWEVNSKIYSLLEPPEVCVHQQFSESAKSAGAHLLETLCASCSRWLVAKFGMQNALDEYHPHTRRAVQGLQHVGRRRASQGIWTEE